MSQLSEFRRKVLKKSQQVLSDELGYENWKTYAAQEQGRNPFPLEVKERLEKKYKFKGPWPAEEKAPQPNANPGSMSSYGMGSSSGYSTLSDASTPKEMMSAGEAAQRASAILREVLTAAPHLREKWSDEDKDEFLGGVTQILISVPKPAVEDTLRQLLLAVAKGTMKRSGTPEDVG